MDNENEIWKDIPDYEGYYQASSEGRIRSVGREVAYNDGRVRIHNGKVLKPGMSRGYLIVNLCKNGKVKALYIHRLVWMTFNGAIPDGLQVNHIDECKTNNRLENLNLMTCKENINFGTHNQRMAKAMTNHPSMSKAVIGFDADGKIVFQFPSAKEAQRQGFNHGNLSACCRGERKTHRGYRWRYKEELENA